MVPDVKSWWNFHRHFWWMFPPIWHHPQVHQECPYPPRLQEETWRTGGVLTWFCMSDLDETFTETSDGCSLPSDTISRSIRNVHVLLDSSKGSHPKKKRLNFMTSSQFHLSPTHHTLLWHNKLWHCSHFWGTYPPSSNYDIWQNWIWFQFQELRLSDTLNYIKLMYFVEKHIKYKNSMLKM